MERRHSNGCCNLLCALGRFFRKKHNIFIFLLIVSAVIFFKIQMSKTMLKLSPGSRFELRHSDAIISNHLTTPFPVNEVRHVAFLKVHKASSSTVLNIIYRFGFQRGLTFVLARNGNYLGSDTSSIMKRILLPPSSNKTYDMLCNHVIFNKTIFGHYMPRDTVYIATIREPYERYRSAYHYGRTVVPLAYLMRGPNGTDSFEKFIANQEIYEPKNPYYSHTNNRMAIDFGFPVKYFKNSTKMLKYVHDLDLTLDLVMITERFDESMILLRRMLNWSFKDILYIKQNAPKNKTKNNIDSTLIDKVKKFSELDYILYDYFYEKFDKKVKQQSSDFNDEVSAFKSIRERVAQFCLNATSSATHLWVADTKWNGAFSITFHDCEMLVMDELTFLDVVVKEQKSRISKYGINREFFDLIPNDRHKRK